MSELLYIFAGVAVLIAVVVIYGLAQRKRGKAEANKKAAERAVENARKSQENRERVRNMSDDDLNRLLSGDRE